MSQEGTNADCPSAIAVSAAIAVCVFSVFSSRLSPSLNKWSMRTKPRLLGLLGFEDDGDCGGGEDRRGDDGCEAVALFEVVSEAEPSQAGSSPSMAFNFAAATRSDRLAREPLDIWISREQETLSFGKSAFFLRQSF